MSLSLRGFLGRKPNHLFTRSRLCLNFSVSYFLKAIKWARKYGLHINIDFHALPGSQNGWNHSGRLGEINFLNGPMGYANAQRALDYMRIIAEFVSQPQYRDVVTIFGIINEPRGSFMGFENLASLYVLYFILLLRRQNLRNHKLYRSIQGRQRSQWSR